MTPRPPGDDDPSEPATQADRNERLVREYFEAVWNQGDLAAFETDLVSDDYVVHHRSDVEYSLADFRTAWRDWHRAFPDLSVEIEDLVATDDRVVVRYRVAGTHEGPVMGVPATGRHVETAGIAIFGIEDGRIAEEWAMDDVFGLLRQLGEFDETTDVVVVGAGQAGLATSYYLTEAGCDHVVLERGQVGERWRSERWDSFTLVTPNLLTSLPGFPYEGDDPDGFLTRDEVVAYLEAYVDRFDPPLRTGVEVLAVRQDGAGYTVETTKTTYETENVVVATGPFQRPRIPELGDDLPSTVRQLHSSQYRNPDQIDPGAVLVVGSGQSGAQIAKELHESGRDVYLSVGKAAKAPRRYRGKDIARWMVDLGGLDAVVDSLPSPADRFAPNPYVSGKDGGQEIDLLDLAADGMTLLGRAEGVEDGRLVVAGDLQENLRNAYRFYAGILGQIDDLVETEGIDAPEPEFVPRDPEKVSVESVRELDLEAANVRTVIWATGFRFDFDWVEPATFDEYGYPVHDWGVTETPGLYFLGLPWLHTGGSSLLFGVGGDAEYVTDHVLDRLESATPST